jgi:hypothetical protein
MAKFNQKTRTWENQGGSAFPAAGTKRQTTTTTNHTGRAVWNLDDKTNLFFRATSAFAGQDTYYEKGAKRDAEAIALVRKLAIGDWDWTAKFLVWLRAEGNMRTAPVMLAVEAVRARLEKKLHPAAGEMSHRALIAAVLQRADEPGEMLAYYENVVGRTMPKAIKRGIGDAAKRMYNERNFLRYDSSSKAIRFGGVAEMAQMPKTHGWQSDLITYAIGEQHHREQDIPDTLAALRARNELNKMDASDRHVFAKSALGGHIINRTKLDLAMAGQWEWFMSWLGDAKGAKAITTKEKWTFAAQRMGIMAVVRNLRNFDEAGLKTGDSIVTEISGRLTNEEQIAKSRMFPFRFFTAHLQLKSVTWAAGLEVALQHSLQNLPELPGRTLILVDTSGSMQQKLSAKSEMSYAQAAALFGCALKIKNPDGVNLWGFADGQFEAQATTGHSVLRCAEEFCRQNGLVGHGTQMEAAVRATYAGHDRVIIISDMQAFPTGGYSRYGYSYMTGDVAGAVPAHIPVYGFNLASGSTTPLGKGNRHSLGGLSDVTFKLIPQLEKVGRGSWPWE